MKVKAKVLDKEAVQKTIKRSCRISTPPSTAHAVISSAERKSPPPGLSTR